MFGILENECQNENKHPHDLGLEFQKINAGRRINIVEILCLPISRQNRQRLIFQPKFAEK